MGKFTPTKKQKEAFEKVVKAFQVAKKSGLVFYGKSGCIVAYKKNADDYIEKDFQGSLGTGYNQVEYLSSSKCISDSGGDDYGGFRTLSDQEEFS